MSDDGLDVVDSDDGGGGGSSFGNDTSYRRLARTRSTFNTARQADSDREMEGDELEPVVSDNDEDYSSDNPHNNSDMMMDANGNGVGVSEEDEEEEEEEEDMDERGVRPPPQNQGEPSMADRFAKYIDDLEDDARGWDAHRLRGAVQDMRHQAMQHRHSWCSVTLPNETFLSLLVAAETFVVKESMSVDSEMFRTLATDILFPVFDRVLREDRCTRREGGPVLYMYCIRAFLRLVVASIHARLDVLLTYHDTLGAITTLALNRNTPIYTLLDGYMQMLDPGMRYRNYVAYCCELTSYKQAAREGLRLPAGWSSYAVMLHGWSGVRVERADEERRRTRGNWPLHGVAHLKAYVRAARQVMLDRQTAILAIAISPFSTLYHSLDAGVRMDVFGDVLPQCLSRLSAVVAAPEQLCLGKLRGELLVNDVYHALLLIRPMCSDKHSEKLPCESALMAFLVRVLIESPFSVKMQAITTLQQMTSMENRIVDLCDLESEAKKHRLIEVMLRDNLHHAAYVDRLERVVVSLAPCLSEEDVDLLWKAQQADVHDAVKRNLHRVIGTVVPHLPHFRVELLFKLMTAEWACASERGRASLIELLRRMGCGSEVVKPELEEVCVRRLYEWSIGEDSSPATQQAAETAMCKLLEQQLCRGTDKLVMAYIQETCNIIKKDGEGVASAVSLLKHLLLLHPAHAADGSEMSVRAQLIRDVDGEFELVSHLVAASGRMVEKEEEKQVTGEELSPFVVSSGLSLRLDLLRFVLAEGRQKMQQQHMRSLWHSQVECAASRWRCSLGFDLFAAALTQGLLDDATLASFYQDCVLSYPPSSLCPSAMSCLEVFFLHVNLLAGGLRMVDAVAGKEDGQEMSYEMQRPDLMGTWYLWRVVCECVDGEVAGSATRLFVRLHTRTSEALRKGGGSSGGGSSVQEDVSLSTSPSSASASESPSPTAGGGEGMEECGAGADTTTPLSYAETVVNECMRRICESSAPSSVLSGVGGEGGGGQSMLSVPGQGGETDEGVESAGEEEPVEGDTAEEGDAGGVDRRERMRRLVKLLSLLVSSDDLCACLARRRRPPLARAMHGNPFVLVVKWPAEERSLTTRQLRDVRGEERLEMPVHTNTTLYEVVCQTARKTEYDMPEEVIQRLQMCRVDSGMVYRPDDLKCTLGELCVTGGVELAVRLRRTSDTEQDLSSLAGPDGRECLLMGAALSKHHTDKLLELAEQGCSGGGEGEAGGDADALINVLLAAPVDAEMERSVVCMAESREIGNRLPRMSPAHALYTVELLRSVFAPAGWTDKMSGGVRSYGQNGTSREELDEEWRKQCVLLRGWCVSGLIELVDKCVVEAEEERRMEGGGGRAEVPSSSRVHRSRVSLRTRTLAAAIALLKQMLAVIARVRQQSLSGGPTTSTQARLFETIFLPHEGTLRKLCTVVAVRVAVGKEGSVEAETSNHIHNMYKDKCAEQVVRHMLMIARQAAAVGRTDEGGEDGEGGEPAIVSVRVSRGMDECVEMGEGEEERRMCEQLAIDAMQVALLLQSWEDSAAACLLCDNEFASVTRCMLTANSRCIRSAGQQLAAHFCMAVATAGGHAGERAATECLRGWLDEREQLGADERAAIEYYRMVADVIRRFNEVSLPIPSVQSYYAHTMTWLRDARDYTREHHVSYPDDNILLGHLQLAAHLASTLSREIRESGGVGDDGRGVEWVGDILSEFCFAGCDESEEGAEGTGAPAPTRSHTLQQMSSALALPRSVSAHVVPSRAAVNASVCGTVESRRAAFSLLVSLCADSHELLLEACHHLRAMFYREDAVVRRDFDYQPEAAVRASADSYAGLKNGGATCYMNSIMQQLFMIPSLRHAVLQAAAEPGKGGVADGGGEGGEKTDKTEYCVQVLLAIQSMFAHLVGFELESHTPQLFWNTFKLNGSSLNVREQQDALEFYDQVVDLIDAALKRVGEPAAAAAIMGGEFADEKICKDCPHRFMKQEEFTSIALDVRSHNNLLDSLKEYVRGEILENDNAYHCDKCDKKVAAVKRLSIKRLPQVLVVQLKRFDFDWEKEQPVKFNDYFEFPMEVDMAPFTLEGLDAAAAEGGGEEKEGEKDKDREKEQGKECGYRLRGVVVHSGQAGGGHYYSFIRADGDRDEAAGGGGGEHKEKWFKFDDTDVTPFDATPDEVRSKWFGADEASVGEGGGGGGGGGGSGRRRRPHNWWNAYILFYEQISPVSPACASLMATQEKARVEKCEEMKEEGWEGTGEENPLDATMASVAEEACEASTSGEGGQGQEEAEGKEQWRASVGVERRGSCSSDRSVCGVRDRLRAESASPLTKLHSRFSIMSLSRGMRDMPAHLEAMVRRENRKMAHERAQFSQEFFLLVDQLVDRTIKEAQAARHRGRDRGEKQFVELCVGGMELLCLFMVHTGLHATVALRTPSRMCAWLDYLSFLLSSCGEARAAVAVRVLLQHDTNTLMMFAAPKEIRHQYLTVVASCVRAAVVGRDSIRGLEPCIHVLSPAVRAHCSLAAADSDQCLLADVLIHALVTCSKSRFAASYTSPVDYHCLLVQLALGEEEEGEGGEAMSDGEKATKHEDSIVMLRCLVSNMAALQLAAQFNKDVTADVAMARAIALCLRVTDISALQPSPPCGACNPWQLPCPLVSVGEKSELFALMRFPNQIRKLMRALSECVRVSAECGRLCVWEEATAGMAAVAWRNDSFARMAVEALVEQYAHVEGAVPSRYSAYSNHQQQEKNKAVSQQILSSLRLICSPCAGDENKAKLFGLILTEMAVSCLSPRGPTPIGLAEAWRRIDGDAPRNMVATIIAEAALAVGEEADEVFSSTEQLSSLRDCLETVAATRLANGSTAVAEGAWPRVWHCFSQRCEQWQRRRHDAVAATVLGQLSVDTTSSDACVTSPCPVSGEKRRYPGCPGEADEEEEEEEEAAGAGPSRRSSKKWSGGPDTLPFGVTAAAAPPPVYNFSPGAGSLPPAPAFVAMEEMPEWTKDHVSSITRRNPFHDPLGDDDDEKGGKGEYTGIMDEDNLPEYTP